MKHFFGLVLCALLAGTAPMTLPADALTDSELADRIRNRLETAYLTDSLEVGDDRLHARQTLRRVYLGRSFRPLWVSETGRSARAEAFEAWMEVEPWKHGLDPAYYHLKPIEELNGADSLGALVDLELALSDAFLMLGSHLLAGRLDPTTLDPEWHAMRRQRDLGLLLEEALELDDPGEALEQLLPSDPAYFALTRELARLRQIAETGGWQAIPQGSTLHEGDIDDRVPALAARLGVAEDRPDHSENLFSPELAAAVVAFQGRHGLSQDGVVGRATLAALNVPVEARIDQILVNLERWRWLPESLGERFVLVNIASFDLDVVEGDSPVLSMRVVVGKTYRRTPVFSGKISYLVFNPAWEVPYRIAVRDKLPLIQADLTYLEQNNFLVFQGWGAEEKLIDPATVDWSALSPSNFPYRLRQLPGPINALGRVKFMFPNEFSVYLHDTPTRELFAEESRVFSSGCIRLERPIELAEWLLRGYPQWSPASLEEALMSAQEQIIRLDEPLPVHILYWTAWVDREGNLNFRNDVYDRDARVLASLALAPPSPGETENL